MSSGRGRGRRKASRTRLRKDGSIDGFSITEAFTFTSPSNVTTTVLPDDAKKGDNSENSGVIGEGCYASGLIGGRRFYGILVEQSALKTATKVYFQSEASSLELNRRIMMLKNQNEINNTADDKKRTHDITNQDENAAKKQKLNELALQPTISDQKLGAVANRVTSSKLKAYPAIKEKKVQIQKFRFVDGSNAGPGYRDLVATYADLNAASDDDEEKLKRIKEACETGGNFVGKYYYQYEVKDITLKVNNVNYDLVDSPQYDIWSSLGFHTFLRHNPFPPWFPLSNLGGQQTKVLSMLQMKKSSDGNVVWDKSNSGNILNNQGRENISKLPNPLAPIQPRNCIRVGIIGGGISGLACASELLRLSKAQDLSIEVVLLEGRPRLGGRLLTDYNSFRLPDGKGFPVDLGASWIHGIDKNPLAYLAKQININFVPASEDVKILSGGMQEVDKNIDKRIAKLFDEILDEAASQCWSEDDDTRQKEQIAIRWYGAVLSNTRNYISNLHKPQGSDVPKHRQSSDVSIDGALARVVHKRSDLIQLSPVEQNLLVWNTKNTEYALAANIRDLSMKYWDADELHAFKGDHVLLKEGYSTIVNFLLQRCQSHTNFRYELNFPVKKIQYARNTASIPFLDKLNHRKLVDLSDTCCVTSKADKKLNFDFVVSTLPLGVLKNRAKDNDVSTDTETNDDKVTFEPKLPTWKGDSIDNTGFGLLNKVVLMFPNAFWRKTEDREFLRGTPYLGKEEFQFGNASGKNSEHYIFYDLGKIMIRNNDYAPAILLTLISGLDAVLSEQLTDDELTNGVLETLQHLYSGVQIPKPLISRRTKWGSDIFSRGSYTFLPPGATDEDYLMLQYPINANSESFNLGEAEIMRLFWAGEHTTSFHPSTAHGAYLSGIRAANEVVNSCFVKDKIDQAVDQQIPLSFYRMKQPASPLVCQLCQKQGGRNVEGALLAFQKGTKRALVHANCIKYTPDVDIGEGSWKHVFKALNRAKQLRCNLCKKSGASIGCVRKDCNRSYHYQCSLDTGWTYEKDERTFRCDSHRLDSNPEKTDSYQEVPISLDYFKTKDPFLPVQCFFCRQKFQDNQAGNLLGFQQGCQRILVHEECIRNSNIIEDGTWNENADNYFNVFKSYNESQRCLICFNDGATIKCSLCTTFFHYVCAKNDGWDFTSNEEYKCKHHRKQLNASTTQPGILQHDLFFRGAKTANEVLSKTVPHQPQTSFQPLASAQPLPMSQPQLGMDASKHFQLNQTNPTPHNSLGTVQAYPANMSPPHLLAQANLVAKQAHLTQANMIATQTQSSTQYNMLATQPHSLPLSNNIAPQSQSASKTSIIPSLPQPLPQPQSQPAFQLTRSGNETNASKTPEKKDDSFTMDPKLVDDEIKSNYHGQKLINAKKPNLEDLWGIRLAIIDNEFSRTLRVNANDAGEGIRYGLRKSDIIIEINGVKLGSPELKNIRLVLELMKKSIDLNILVLTKEADGEEVPQILSLV